MPPSQSVFGRPVRYDTVIPTVGTCSSAVDGVQQRKGHRGNGKGTVETQVDVPWSAEERAERIRNPYPFFATKRNEAGVFRGSVMDYSKLPESMRPKQNYAAMSFDSVNLVFRDGKVFNSAMYDATIGLFIGP